MVKADFLRDTTNSELMVGEGEPVTLQSSA